MRIVAWIGNAENQKALAAKIHAVYKVDAVFIEKKNNTTPSWLNLVFNILPGRFFFPSISSSWKELMGFYQKKGLSLAGTTVYEVENINCEETYSRTSEIAPDLIIVSGTRIIRDKLLSLRPGMGILNLHTGLSPYIKGGPNCTNWCISTEQFHLIGNTVMWLNESIDAGDIVVSRLSDLTGHESFRELHLKVMEEAHALYLYAIDQLIKGLGSRVPQKSIDQGKTYYTKNWKLKQKLLLVRNFRKFRKVVSSEAFLAKKLSVKTVDFKHST